MRAFASKKILALLALVVASFAVGGASVAPAALVPKDLCASTGQITMPDGALVDVWGFVETGSCVAGLVNDTNFPGPIIDVNVNDDVTITLSSALPGSHTASFELSGLPVTVSGTTYTFNASRPGTFVYQSPGDAGRQTAMGLYGALIVRPSPSGQAYQPASTAYNVEATLVLSQIDPNFNAAPDTSDMNDYLATYWLINGKAFPDTTPIAASAGQKVLLRYVNAGYDNTSMALLGMHERVIARDAYLLNNPFLADAETIPAGGTEDTIATVPSTGPPSANGFALFNRNLHVTTGTPFTGGFSPTIYGSLADLNGDGLVNGADDSNAFYGDTSIIDGGLDCNALTASNDGAAGDGAINSTGPDADDCTLIGYDGVDGVTIDVVGGEFQSADTVAIPNGTPLPTVFNAAFPNNPSVVAADFAWSTINGRVNSNGNLGIDGDDCHFGLIGQAVDAGLGDATDGADVLGSDPGCGFATSIASSLNGLVDLNSDMAITPADSCYRCFFGHAVVVGVVSTYPPGGMLTFITP